MSTSSEKRPVMTERAARAGNGYVMAALGLALGGLGAAALTRGLPVVGLPLCLLGALTLAGLYMLNPNQAAALTLFGAYIGSDRGAGLRWANPFALKKRVSLRDRNLNAPVLKVNDQRGNPIEIAAVVVWRVRDTAQALFQVDDYEAYVRVQAEAAIRHLAACYAYDHANDAGEPDTVTLRGGQDIVAQALRAELQARFADAGVDVLDAKISHLAYAPEIAQVMLRRQQAEAIIGARAKIVQGAVTMVETALQGLSEREIVVLDDERKAAMVSNLLVVLCSDRETQPVVNTGTLYT
ncbi:MAG: SPFH domain-containing protein [Pelomonas sp.]|nr:SPFH domain-containing protein [Roseateles sp.]